MDKRQKREVVSNPELISGIFNYCDRWCERCTLSARCAVFAMEQGSPAHDPDNEAFWLQLHDTLRVAAEMLMESAQESGIDLDTLVPGGDEALDVGIDEEVLEHPLVREATENTFVNARDFVRPGFDDGSR